MEHICSYVIKFSDIERDVMWVKYFTPDNGEIFGYEDCHPFNHYESPYMSDSEFEIYKRMQGTDNLMDIELNIEEQKNFFSKMEKYSKSFFETQGEERRYTKNSMFGEGDALLLHSMIMEYKPKKIIEIGSGYSTSILLDTNEYYVNHNMDITCIEPNPERLFSILKNGDEKRLNIREDFVQNVPLEEFDKLEENDILFIDSSHVAKLGGDVPYEYFCILPRIKKGVIIHIHDIMYPFTYPEQWILRGRAYNEVFILRALLMNNNVYRIMYFNDMMDKLCRDDYQKIESKYRRPRLGGSSIWLRKV